MAGRPTKYDPDYCEQVISFGKQGFSLAQIAFELDIHRDTLHEWTKVHPEFSDAIKKARSFSQGWWENKLTEAATGEVKDGKNPNATLMIFAMKNRFPEEWREKQTTEHEISNVKKVVVEWGE